MIIAQTTRRVAYNGLMVSQPVPIDKASRLKGVYSSAYNGETGLADAR